MKKLIGLFASVALMGSGMALAHDKSDKDKQTQTQTQPQSGSGGSGNLGTPQSGSTQGSQMGQSGSRVDQSGSQVGKTGMSEQLGGNQLTGRVVKSERKMIWIEHSGAVIPLKIDKNTQFTDPDLKRATDFQEGDQVTASFEVRKTDNFLTSIGKSNLHEGRGGSGLKPDVLTPDQGINEDKPMDPTLPPGAGGSGLGNQGSDIREGESPESGVSDDMGKDTRKSDY